MRSIGACCVFICLAWGCSEAAPDARRGGGPDRGAPTGAVNGAAGVGGDFGNSEQPVTQQDPVEPQADPPPIDGGNCNQDVDVVFVIDVSGSMVSPLTKLQAEVGMVDAALRTKNLPSPPHYGLVVFVDDVIMMNGGQPFTDLNALTSVLSDQITQTNLRSTRQADLAILEQNYSWPENSLDALHAAATGFAWRPADTTLRVIIHFTDASFWDGTAVSSAAGDPMGLEAPGGCSTTPYAAPAECTMVSSVHGYAETIDALRAANVWTNTFSALTGGPPNGWTAQSPPSHGPYRGEYVDVSIGFHKPYAGMNSIADSTGGLAWNIDDVYDGVISLADPINQAITERQCVDYPPPPPPPPPPE